MDDKRPGDRSRRKSTRQKPTTGTAKASSSPPPGFGPGKKSPPTAPSEMDVDTILAELGTTAPDPAQPLPGKGRKPSTDKPPGGTEDRQVMREMIAQMQELTDEVKQLRTQMGTDTPTPPAYSGRRSSTLPPEVAAIVDTLPTARSDPSSPPTPAAGRSPRSVPTPGPDTPPPPPAKKNKALSVISSLMFYVIVVAMVFGAFLVKSSSGGRPTMVAGFSAFTVLTSSMQDVYPQGSLIITRQMDAKDLVVGDDITFMVSETTTITHRIIGITENFQSTGERAFETQGVMNPNPDKDLVAATNVVGKVIFHSKALGDIAAFVTKNWPFLLFLIVILIALFTFLKWNSRKSNVDKATPPAPTPDDPPTTHTKKQRKHQKRRTDTHGYE